MGGWFFWLHPERKRERSKKSKSTQYSVSERAQDRDREKREGSYTERVSREREGWNHNKPEKKTIT
jgi:hypothetical protein